MPRYFFDTNDGSASYSGSGGLDSSTTPRPTWRLKTLCRTGEVIYSATMTVECRRHDGKPPMVRSC